MLLIFDAPSVVVVASNNEAVLASKATLIPPTGTCDANGAGNNALPAPLAIAPAVILGDDGDAKLNK